MKQKRNKDKTEVCFDFESKYNSMKTIINSLEKISAKCELFFRQFNVQINNQNQLDDYKKLLTGFKSELGSEYVRQPIDDNQQTIATRSHYSSDNDSDFVANASDDYYEESDDQSVEKTKSSCLQNGDQSIVDQLSEKITVFYQKNKKSRKKVKHYGCPVSDCDFKSTARSNVVTHVAKHRDDTENNCFWPKCEKTFSFRNSMISHIESYHLRKERYKCCVEGCGQPFLTKVNLHSHMKSLHSDVLEHNCIWTKCYLNQKNCVCLWPKCGQQLDSKELLDTHMEDIHLKRKTNTDSNEESEEWLNCDKKDCDFQTVSKKELTEHKAQHKSKYVPINRRKPNKRTDREPEFNKYTGKALSKRRRPKNFKCSWPACEAAFESQHTVAIHMRKHTGEKPFECDWPECGKSFRFKGALKLHKESIHLKLKQFKCDQCDEAFLLLTALTVHKSKHTGVKRLQCSWPGCEWRTNFSQQLEIHRMRTHEGKKVYLKKYKTKKTDPHSIYDSDGKLKPFTCEWPGCERRFKFECNIEPHLKWHQKSESGEPTVKKKYVYPRKPRAPKTPKEKKERKRRGNPVDKPFRCNWPECQSTYTTKNMLSQHINTHTGVKPYQCESCQQAFCYKSSLNSHMSTVHNPLHQLVDRPYHCTFFQCNRSFATTRSLMAHQRIVHKIKGQNDDQFPHYGLPYDDSYSSSTHYSSPPPQGVSEPYFQKSVIRLDRIKAFNSMQIQTQNQNLMSYPTSYRRDRQVMTPTPQTTHTTARKLLTNALKRPKSQSIYSTPVDSEAIAKELPNPCTYQGCWRRFKTVKALEWHLKKFHSS